MPMLHWRVEIGMLNFDTSPAGELCPSNLPHRCFLRRGRCRNSSVALGLCLEGTICGWCIPRPLSGRVISQR